VQALVEGRPADTEMDRRRFLCTLAGGVLAAPFAAEAQQAAKIPVIGVLDPLGRRANERTRPQIRCSKAFGRAYATLGTRRAKTSFWNPDGRRPSESLS